MRNVFVTLFCMLCMTLIFPDKAQAAIKEANIRDTSCTTSNIADDDLGWRKRRFDLEEQHKKTLKSVKKRFKAKEVTIEEFPNGKWYYVLHNKKGYISLVDQSGEKRFFSSRSGYYYYDDIVLKELLPGDMRFYLYEDGGKRFGIGSLDGELQIDSHYSQIKPIKVEGNDYLLCTSILWDPNGELELLFPDGKRIIYFSKNIYSMSLSAGTSNIQIGDDSINIYHKKMPTIFVAEDDDGDIRLYSTNGEQLSNKYGISFLLLNAGYILIGVEEATISKRSTTINGENKTYKSLEIKPKYSYLNLFDLSGTCIIDTCDELEYSELEHAIYYTRQGEDRIYRKGAIFLQDTTKNIPPIGASAFYECDEAGEWHPFIKRTTFSDPEAYIRGKEYPVTYPDEGELKYDQHSYGYAFSIYNSMKRDSLTQKQRFIAVSAALADGLEKLNKQIEICNKYRQDKDGSEVFMSYEYTSKDVYVDQEQALEILKDYKRLAGPQDTVQANVLNWLLSETAKQLREYAWYTIPQEKAAYEGRIATAKREQEIARQQAEARRKAEQQARNEAIAIAILNTMGNVLSTMSNNNSGANSTISTNSWNNTQVQSNAVQSSGGGSSETNKGLSASSQARLIDLKRDLAKAIERLANAEASYAKDPSVTTKNLVRSAQKQVDTLKELIRELE